MPSPSAKPIVPTFLADPFAAGLRQGGFSKLTGLTSMNPFSAGFLDEEGVTAGDDDAFFDQSDDLLNQLLTGTGSGNAGLAGRTIQEGLETGFRPDLDPLYERGQNQLENELLPAVNESLGSQYGIRFGTPQAEAGSRAARDVAIETNAQLLPYLDSAANRRLGAASMINAIPGQYGTLAAQRGSQREARTSRAANTRLAGVSQYYNSIINALGAAGGQFKDPQFDNSSAQNQQAIMSLIGTILGNVNFGGGGGKTSSAPATNPRYDY